MKKEKGLGDTIEHITEATGIKTLVHSIFGNDCGCDERKEKLNKLFPYKVECLTEEEYIFFSTFNWDLNILDIENQNYILGVFNRVFNQKRVGTSCATCWRTILGDLHKLYTEYKK